ncbi:prolyl aminopeptidase [Aliiroseovarius sp. YM-037]|uniref:prolyl aminopeptidase n=1 Tax=Aliiroseovarius sp. YM-037 TaxID=3341728 RepID=UPI003A7FC37E
MDKYAGQMNAAQKLFPPSDPFARHMMDVGDGHQVYVEQCGRPDGVPVVVLHGGPGGGCSPAMRRFFDPDIYNVILFDQRGCGRSRPYASVEANTTWHLVADIEHIREALGIDAWIVFGGSWGATLALIYAQSWPERVRHLVLRGVFLATESELRWFYGGGAARFWPERWAEFESLVPEDERDDLIGAYHKRLFSGNSAQETRFARAWTAWENALASLGNGGRPSESPAEYARAFARLENHYFTNKAFLSVDGQIMRDVDKIAGIPGDIVQGRYDMICPPEAAMRLAGKWGKKAALQIIPNAGHALSEPGIAAALVAVMNRIGRRA